MGKPGPVKIKNYGIEFKLRAVQLSDQPGVLVKDVAESLCIHPPVEPAAVVELQRLRDVEKQFKRLQMEHDLLKRAIRFASDLKAKSSPSSRQTGKPGPSK